MEFYLEKETVIYPLYKIDTIFTYDKDLYNFTTFYITESLKQSLKKLFRINFDEVLIRGRKLSINEIELNNNRNLAIQILNDVELKKGVYKNFIEFKTNKPSITNYELRVGKMGDILYVMENGQEYPMRNAWGFCNGTELYVNSSDKYFKLIKRQNTFYFAGIKGIERKAKHDLLYTSLYNLITDTGRKKTKFSIILKHYKLDMETGEVY